MLRMASSFCNSYTMATPVDVWPQRPYPATGGPQMSGKALAETQKAWAFFEMVEAADAATRVKTGIAGSYRPPNIESQNSIWYPLNTTSNLLMYTKGQVLHWEVCPSVNWTSQRNLGFPTGSQPFDIRPKPCG